LQKEFSVADFFGPNLFGAGLSWGRSCGVEMSWARGVWKECGVEIKLAHLIGVFLGKVLNGMPPS